MEDLINDNMFKSMQYIILGKEHQVLNIILAPGKLIYAVDTSVICCSEEFIRIPKKQAFNFKQPKISSGFVKFLNTSEGMGYLTLNYKGGRIITLGAKRMRDMIFDEDYVLAYTSGISLTESE